jgi:hypothetical protein
VLPNRPHFYEREKRQTSDIDYYDFVSHFNQTKESAKPVVQYSTDPRPQQCRSYEKAMQTLLQSDPSKARQFVPDELMPKPLDLTTIMADGCDGFATSILGWPEPLIIGGVKHTTVDGKQQLIKAEAYQTVMMLASAPDLFARYGVSAGVLPATP